MRRDPLKARATVSTNFIRRMDPQLDSLSPFCDSTKPSSIYSVSSLEELPGTSPSARLAEAWEEGWDAAQEVSG